MFLEKNRNVKIEMFIGMYKKQKRSILIGNKTKDSSENKSNKKFVSKRLKR